MTTYAALLRGINLGSRAKISMADLRNLFTDLGLADVTTYLRSGNVVFRVPGEGPTQVPPPELAANLEQRIARDLDLPVTVLLRTADDLGRVVAGSPYLRRETDLAKLHVTFLAAAPDGERAARIAAPAGEPAEFRLAGREVYLHTPNGYGRTKLSNAWFERHLGVAATTRNWRTVTMLRDLAAG